MLAIASHIPSTTQLKWSLIGFGILVLGTVLFLQQSQVSQLRSELAASRNEVTLVRTSEAKTDDGKAAEAKQTKSTQADTSTSGEKTPVADSDKQPVAQNSGGTTGAEHPDGCNCPIHTPSVVGTPVQQQVTPGSSEQSQPQQSPGLVPSLLGGLTGGLL